MASNTFMFISFRLNSSNKILPWGNEEIDSDVIQKCEMNNLICVNLPIWIICLETDDAVRRFQLMNGLNPDGIYGPKTKAKLESLLK
ncbi:hypothetical protein ABE35_12165 [Bacillus subtilis]|nr:hypothetical protein [Bacillus subtilis]MBG9488375.1 hypothetical protein [Bacillus subtilis]MBG9571369.1 hypothetical protein [Bacillus subtilis]